ncbi:MAG TPA: carbon-nitrogen hydrolase family protein [Pseudomonadota bacterium]|nr:carbon-nitrogen hydrolase family protein [Pseudomonadota bacterium]
MTRIAALQFKAHKDQPAASLAALCQLIDEAAAAGASLVVCPEMAYTGYLFENAAAILPHCETARGGAFPRLSELAQRHGIYLVCGYPEIGESQDPSPPTGSTPAPPRLYNSARVLSPDGALLCNYRKRLLFTADTTWATEGDTPYPILQTPFGRLTVGICMDLNDDRFTEFLVQQSPLVVAFCTNWLDQGSDVLPYYCYRLRGFAGVFAAANTYGGETSPGHAPTRFCGRSTIFSMTAPAPALDDSAVSEAASGRIQVTVHGRAAKNGDAIVLVEI